MNTYRQRPIEAEAIQWTGTNEAELRAFAGTDFDTVDPQDRIEDPDQDAQLTVEDSHWVGIRPGDWVLKFDGYFVAKADSAFRAVWEPAVSPPAPANRAALRDRIVTALDNAHHTHPCPHTGRPYWLGCVHPDGGVGSCHTGRRADAVLAVLPPPVDRAAVLGEAANALAALGLEDSLVSGPQAWVEAVEMLRRLAGEAPQPETQADPALLGELQQHLADHTPSCNARTDHLMRRAAWALGAPRPVHIGGNGEDCPGCEGTNPAYPFICPGPDAQPAAGSAEGAQR